MKSYAVIGLGRFGSALSRQLCKLGAEVLALDVRADFVQQISGDVTHAVVGDAQDKEVLKALGVRNLDCAVIAIGDNLAASVLIAMNLKELGVPYVVCKAHDETHRKVLEKLGVELAPMLRRLGAPRIEGLEEFLSDILLVAAMRQTPFDRLRPVLAHLLRK